MKATKQASEANLARSLLPMVLALAALVIGAGRSEASLEKLRKDMSAFAVELKQWLKDRGDVGIVTMSSFQNLPELGTNPGPGLTLMLTQELKMAEVPLRVTAPLGINGKLYRFPEKGEIDRIKEFTVALEIVGPGSRVVLRENLKVTGKEARDLIKGHDAVTIRGSRFFKGPYGAEILVNGRPRPAKLVDGIPFVVLEPDDEYTIRLVNESEQEAAVWVGIDGISMFAFSEDLEPNGRWRDYWVLVAGRKGGEEEGVLPVKGWYFHNRDSGSRKFRVTEYPKSAAYLKGMSAGQLGMITLQFRETWPEGTKPKMVGTGFGTAFTQKWTRVKRDIGQLKATITIRYDKK